MMMKMINQLLLTHKDDFVEMDCCVQWWQLMLQNRSFVRLALQRLRQRSAFDEEWAFLSAQMAIASANFGWDFYI